MAGLIRWQCDPNIGWKRLWILYTQMIFLFLFLFYNEAGVFGCAEKLPSGSLAMTVVLRSTPPFFSSNTGEREKYALHDNESQTKRRMMKIFVENQCTKIQIYKYK